MVRKNRLRKRQELKNHEFGFLIVIALLVLVVVIFMFNEGVLFQPVDVEQIDSDSGSRSNVRLDNGFSYLQMSETSSNDPYDDLYAYWSFDIFGNKVYDLSNNNRDGIFVGGASLSDGGKYGKALSLSGSDGKYVKTVEDAEFADRDLTITAWIKVEGTSFENTIVAREEEDGGPNKQFNFVVDGNRLKFVTYTWCEGSRSELESSSTLNINQWHHVAAVLNHNSDKKLYIDGQLRGSSSSNAKLHFCEPQETTIGARERGGGDRAFDGKIDEVMIFQNDLTQNEIQEIYNEQASRFKPSGTITYTNVPSLDGADLLEVSFDETLNYPLLDFTVQIDEEGDGFSGETEYDVTGGVASGIPISGDFDLRINFDSDPDEFYTPILSGILTLSGSLSGPLCGNGQIEEGEFCDGSNLNGHTCSSLGYDGGALGCSSCNFDMSSCFLCGNGQVEASENCDSDSVSCSTEGEYVGTRSCLNDCSGYGECTTSEFCGDGIVNGDEICETADVSSCNVGSYNGEAECLPDCSGFSSCVATEFCGDNIVNGEEGCDDGLANGQPNQCDIYCVETTVSFCGNDVVESQEECDGSDLGVCTSGVACSSCTCEIPPPPTVQILSPQDGDTIFIEGENENVLITIGASNFEIGGKGEKHLQIRLSEIPGFFESPLDFYNGDTNSVEINGGATSIATWISEDKVMFNNVPVGEHELIVSLVDADFNVLNNLEAIASVTFSLHQVLLLEPEDRSSIDNDEDFDSIESFEAEDDMEGNEVDNENLVPPAIAELYQWQMTFSENNKELSSKGTVTKILQEKQRVILQINGNRNEYVGLIKGDDGGIEIEFSSDPIKSEFLTPGDEIVFDSDGDGENDVRVKFIESVTDTKSRIEISALGIDEEPAIRGDTGDIFLIFWLALLIVLLMIVSFFIYRERSRTNELENLSHSLNPRK